MIVTFSGIDGSGKTTQAMYTIDLLESNGLEVIYIHMIQWSTINWLGRLLYSKRNNQNDFLNQTNYEKGRFGLIRRVIMILDLVRFIFFSFYQCKIRGRSIVCDRYFYDLGVQALNTGVFDLDFEMFYWRLVPQPDIAVLLDISPSLAEIREGGEHTLPYYEKKRGLYLNRVSRWGGVVIPVKNLHDTQNRITKELGLCLERR